MKPSLNHHFPMVFLWFSHGFHQGYSYGTYVGGVYASVFSDSSGRVVLDGDMEASPRKDAQAEGDAIANAPR